MKYLLDTCILVNHLRGRKMIDQKVANEGLAISAITWTELKHGTEKALNKEKDWQLCQNLVSDFNIEILPVDKIVGEKCGVLKCFFDKMGQKREDFDLLIASTAIIYKLKLVTENFKHFEKMERLNLA